MSLLTNCMGRCNLIDRCTVCVKQPHSIPKPHDMNGLAVDGENPKLRAELAGQRQRPKRRYTCNDGCCDPSDARSIDPVDFSLYQIRCSVNKLKYEQACLEGYIPRSQKPSVKLPHYVPKERDLTPTEEGLLSKTRYRFLTALRGEERELRRGIRRMASRAYSCSA